MSLSSSRRRRTREAQDGEDEAEEEKKIIDLSLRVSMARVVVSPERCFASSKEETRPQPKLSFFFFFSEVSALSCVFFLGLEARTLHTFLIYIALCLAVPRCRPGERGLHARARMRNG